MELLYKRGAQKKQRFSISVPRACYISEAFAKFSERIDGGSAEIVYKVCHGDFNPSNVIITDDGTPYVIDWAHVTQGNASADAARTYLLFWLNGDISGAKKYLELFCEKSDTAKQYVQKWMPIVAASQPVKGNEREREFLLSWVDIVDYE